MKRGISLALVLALCLSLCACGSSHENTATEISETTQSPFKDPEQETFEISKEAYENINTANEITQKYAQDFYEAWRVAEYNQANVIKGGCSYFADELAYLTEDDVREAMAHLILPDTEGMEWESISEEKKENFMHKTADNIFSYNTDRLLELCVEIVQTWYRVYGKALEAQECLDAAKSLLKKISTDYSDYEYCPQLKDYYTSVSSFLELCNHPVGYSFEQIRETISDYKTDIRDYQNDLDFIFED